jgi:sugar/nucleoside kinase (ribokinase family)
VVYGETRYKPRADVLEKVPEMNRLLVIGGAAFDRLHLPDQTIDSIGGAGMYTAMAARRCGAQVAMFGLRPEPCPERLTSVANHLSEWLGPAVAPADLPQFEISYRGGKTEYLSVSRGAEPTLSPPMLPADLSTYDLAHVTPQSDLELQLSFVQACRQRGAARISAGTDLNQTLEQPGSVRAVLEQSDIFFLNDREAVAVFGSLDAACTEPGKVLFVTSGARGARIIQGDTCTSIPAVPSTVLDPTGAGDTFCGATLAYLLQKQHPIMAARRAVALAAEMIGKLGPTALVSDEPAPPAPLDPRAQINAGQVRQIARTIYSLAEVSPYPTVGPTLPRAGHPKAADFFFAATLHQFSFWTAKEGRYHLPLIAPIGGVKRKGSDYLWYAITRRLEADAEFCSPKRQADLRRSELLEVFRSDDGHDPMPALDLHLEQANRYGRDMLTLELTPQALLDKAVASAQPLQTLLEILDHVGGYKEDPLRKKSRLLAMLLNDRPERFLPLREDEQIGPIIDYHIMRLCLRTGLVEVLDGELARKLADRQVISRADEWAVRYPAYLAQEQLITLSDRSLTAVNGFLFSTARNRCPEMTQPQCQSCTLDPLCAHRKAYFQPVLRTTFY